MSEAAERGVVKGRKNVKLPQKPAFAARVCAVLFRACDNTDKFFLTIGFFFFMSRSFFVLKRARRAEFALPRGRKEHAITL